MITGTMQRLNNITYIQPGLTQNNNNNNNYYYYY